ncbi:ribosome silencing factor [Candidatus Margulisiibacteriota bacterium]
MTPEKTLAIITDALEEKKAKDIEIFDIRNQQAITDFIIICTGNTKIHIKALKDELRQSLRKAKVHRISETGILESNWIILDYGGYIIHIMGPEERDFYCLEDLWKNAGVVYH